MMGRETLDKLTRLFLSCKDLNNEEIRVALRGFGVEVDEAKYHVQFYCPACREMSIIEQSGPFYLAPGDGMFTCPECGERFLVVIEYTPLDSTPA